MSVTQPIMYFIPGDDTPKFIDNNIRYYQDAFSTKEKNIASRLTNCHDDIDINHLKWDILLDDESTPWYLIDDLCYALLKDAHTYPNRPGKKVPNYRVLYNYRYKRYHRFKGPSKPVQHPKHTKGYSYRGPGKRGTGERYYALMADDNYYTSVGEPPFRKRGGNLLDNSSWGNWEDEGRSQVGTWKSQGKYRHQWEARVRRNEKHRVSNTKRSLRNFK